jgi:2-desacetyl-2-hydroxyethyl bacteriochlorophyllide A dehydrogenase
MPHLNKAIVCRQPNDLALETRPLAARAPGEARLKILRVGICGTDYHIYEGRQPFLEYPRVIGHELAARVLEAPEGSPFTSGQLVVVNPYVACGRCHACRKGLPNACMKIGVLGVHRDGGMCEEICLPEENLIAADGLSPDQAASVEFLAIGAHAVRRSGLKSGERALVVGAGPIGLGAALFAKIRGGLVTVLDRDASRLAFAVEAAKVDQTLFAEGDVAALIAGATQRDGYDVVFDATGSRASMEASFAYAAHGGRYVMVGLVKEPIAFFDPEFHKRELTLLASRNATLEDFSTVMDAIKNGQAPIASLITHRTTLDAVVADLPRLAHDKRGLIKAMVTVA